MGTGVRPSLPVNAGKASNTGRRSNARTITTGPFTTPTGGKNCGGKATMRLLKPRMQSDTCASMPDRPGRSSCSWLGGHPMTHTRQLRRNSAGCIRRRSWSLPAMCPRLCVTAPGRCWRVTMRIAQLWMSAWVRSEPRWKKRVWSGIRCWYSVPIMATCLALMVVETSSSPMTSAFVFLCSCIGRQAWAASLAVWTRSSTRKISCPQSWACAAFRFPARSRGWTTAAMPGEPQAHRTAPH